MSIKVKCIAEKEIYKNGDFRIIACSPMQTYRELKLSKYMNFSIKGSNIPYITIGKEYELEIEELSTDKYGTSYNVLSCPSIDNLDFHNLSREESFEILMDCTSSEGIVNNILDAITRYIEQVLEEGEESIDTSLIKGVGEAYNKAYCRNLLSKYKYYATMKKYQYYKLDVNDCKALFDKFTTDNKIDKAIIETPYMSLINVLQRSFNYSDKMIMEQRPELSSSEQRCEFCVLDILRRNEADGSTKLNGNIMYSVMKDEYGVPELLPLVVKVCTDSQFIYYDKESKDLSCMDTYMGEVKISNFIKEKLENSEKLDWDYTMFKQIKDGTLTDEQSNILKEVCEHSFVVLNAPAGCGKTSAMNAVLQMIEHYHQTYTCVSFTGRASKRLSEQTNRPANTIHRVCLGEGINTDWLLVDEASMLGVDLMCMLINAMNNENTRILMIGDCEQIPSISVGRVMKDIIESNKVPICTLTKCFRFAQGGMSMVSTMMRKGEFYIDNNDIGEQIITMGKNKDYRFVESDKTMEQIVNEYKRLVDKGIKPKDITVISPLNIRDFGTYKINNNIQAYINPPLPNEQIIVVKRDNIEITFRTNDLVMNTKNNYNALTLEGFEMMQQDPLFTKDDVNKASVFNGEIGKILEIKDGYIKIQFDENILVFDKSDARNLLLAYSSNPFKLQGSQNKWIIVLTISEHERMLNRQLQYTALTRASEGVVEIGEISAMKYCVNTLGDDNRNTWLKDLLLEDKNNEQ